MQVTMVYLRSLCCLDKVILHRDFRGATCFSISSTNTNFEYSRSKFKQCIVFEWFPCLAGCSTHVAVHKFSMRLFVGISVVMSDENFRGSSVIRILLKATKNEHILIRMAIQ